MHFVESLEGWPNKIASNNMKRNKLHDCPKMASLAKNESNYHVQKFLHSAKKKRTKGLCSQNFLVIGRQAAWEILWLFMEQFPSIGQA